MLHNESKKNQPSCKQRDKEIQNEKRNNNANGTNKKDTQPQSNDTKTNRSKDKDKLEVMLVGDSQMRRVDESKLTNDHHVVENGFKPGLTVKEAASLAGKSCSDVIIIHAGTISISNSSPEEHCRDVVETLSKVQGNNPKAKIGFSTSFRKNDD